MLENIKLDIIYYNTQKDFEVEFNLCGCCRMRLLTAVANDIKSFISAIKVAVARSRVVLLCGKLYEDDGLLNIISKAIGRDFEEVDSSLYGIAGDGKTRLLKQSIPLVTESGKLIGCVIEQGPQAIIMISEDKNGRKEIMQNLVHPYIKELSKSSGDVTDETEKSQEEIIDTKSEIIPEPEALSAEEPADSKDFEEAVFEEQEAEENEAQTADETLTETEDEEELETVSLEDFGNAQNDEITEAGSKAEVQNEEGNDGAADEAEDLAEDKEDNSAEDSEDDNAAESNSAPLGLIYAIPDDDYADDDEPTHFSADVFKEYNENFSLIGHIDDEDEKPRRRGRYRRRSPIIPILISLVLCLAAVIIYFLLVKPTQAGIDIGENFSNLFSLALKEGAFLWMVW